MQIFRTIAIACLALAASLLAYGDLDQDRNHPEVRWFTAETEHFRFHYERGLRHAAEACAGRAEAVYPELTALYGHEPSGKTDFLVYDEDYSNGWAIASLNTMAIWDADLGFELRGSKDWIRDVVAHEFAHVVSIQKGSKTPPWIGEAQFGWDDGADRATTSSGWLLWSLNPYSMSMAEGTAQWSSERVGGDRWDSHRAMIQRVAADADSLLPLERMSTFSGTGLDYERVYGQGYSIVRHIARTRGPEFVSQWWGELSRLPTQTPEGAWKRLTGQPMHELWNSWRDSARAQARREIEAASPLVQGRKLFGNAFNTQNPRWWNDSVLLFSSNRGSDFQINSLWAYDLAAKDTADRSWVVSPVIRSRFSLDTNTRAVWFHSGREDDSRGRPVLDLYRADIHPGAKDRIEADKKPDQKRLTVSYHAFAPEVQGDSMLFVMRDRRDFYVGILPSDGESGGRRLYPPKDSLDTTFQHTIFAAVPSPDGTLVAVDRFDGNRRTVDLVDALGRKLGEAGDTLGEWRNPSFSPDGRFLYMASDRTGIFDIYRRNLADSTIEQVTSVPGGAFQPAVSPEGTRLAYVSWDVDGFALHLLDSLRPFPLRPAVVVARDSAPAQDSWIFSMREEPYLPIPDRALLSPILYAQRAQPMFGDEGTRWKGLAGARLQMLDPVRTNTVVLMALVDLGNGFDYFDLAEPNLMNPRQEKMFLFGWENRSLWPTIFMEAAWQNVRGQDTSSVEADYGSGRRKIVQPWALGVGSAVVGARYSLTKNQKIHGEVGWTTYDFDLYESSFRFPAYSSVSPSVFWTYLAKEDGGEGDLADQRGTFARVQYANDRSELQRSGSFSEVFQQEANGAIKVKTNATDIHRFSADFRQAVGNPLWDDQTLEFDAQVGGILGWWSQADTLNDFYLEGLSIPGYPSFKPGTTETRLFQGTRTAYLQATTRFPLLRIRKGAWIWFFDQWSAGASVQAGRAWSGDWIDPDQLRDQVWDFSRSVSWETRLSGRIHSSYPFHLSLKFSRALDEPGGLRQDPATIGGVPTGAHRIEFGLNTGLDEWAIIDQPLRRLGLLPAPKRLP